MPRTLGDSDEDLSRWFLGEPQLPEPALCFGHIAGGASDLCPRRGSMDRFLVAGLSRRSACSFCLPRAGGYARILDEPVNGPEE